MLEWQIHEKEEAHGFFDNSVKVREVSDLGVGRDVGDSGVAKFGSKLNECVRVS
jgi:hypothetical protein